MVKTLWKCPFFQLVVITPKPVVLLPFPAAAMDGPLAEAGRHQRQLLLFDPGHER